MELVTKLRPRKFDNVIGQTNIKEIITAAIKIDRFPKLSLFSGESGVGKSTLAEICALALACESPEGADPCCKCKTCQQNLKALASGKTTDSLVKVNIGLLNSKKDILEVIKEIFVLQPRVNGNVVYILEEVHALPQDSQIPLLEEFMNIPDGIHIMLCTTQPYKLIHELRGRATSFSLGLPSVEECMNLIDLACDRIGIARPNDEAKKWLCRNSGNSPREIVKIVDTLSVTGSLEMDKIKSYLGAVTNDKYIDFFEVLYKSGDDLAPVIFWFEDVKQQGVTLSNFVKGLKDFIIDLAITLYGSINEGFSRSDKQKLKEVFEGVNQSQFLDMVAFIDTMKFYTEKESMYSIFLLKKHIMGITKRQIVTQSQNKANTQTIKSERKAVQQQSSQRATTLKGSNGAGVITGESIQAMLKTNKVFKPVALASSVTPTPPSTERSEVPFTGGGEAPDQQKPTTQPTTGLTGMSLDDLALMEEETNYFGGEDL